MAPLITFLVLFFFAKVSGQRNPADEIAYDYSPFFVLYKNGQINRTMLEDFVPPSLDPITNVESKDIVYSPQYNLSARVYISKNNTNEDKKLPLVVYIHGGGFIFATAFSHGYHKYLNSLASEAKVIAFSFDYRRAPEDPVPAAHDDSWTALKWVASHANGKGKDNWLNNYVDFNKVFLIGDSAGANIVHHMGIRHGLEKLEGVKIEGMVLLYPYFWGKKPIDGETTDAKERAKVEEIWRIARPNTIGADDPLLNPVIEYSKLPNLACNRLMVVVPELDVLKYRGRYYVEKLKESGWKGEATFDEIKGVNHGFNLANATTESAVKLLKTTVSFIDIINGV